MPTHVLETLDLDIMDYETFILANGDIVDLPVFEGKAKIAERIIETWYVPGDSLLGMEFLASIGDGLWLDFSAERVVLL